MSEWEARMSELVHYDAADQVVTLTLDSPHNRNALSRQLVAELTGRLAEARAEPSARAIVITHTETPRALRGRGIASELIEGALALIRADGHKVIAGCGFVVDYLRKHPEDADLVD